MRVEVLSTVVCLRGIHKKFTGLESSVLDGVDLAIRAGESVAIMGPSGSGKSTLLHIAAGLAKPDAGQVAIEGAEPPGRGAWDRLRAHTIGLIFQDSWLLPALTLAQNIELPMLGVEPSATARRARVRHLLEQLGITGVADQGAAAVSGGERQRAACARALANRPRLVLADEPTGNLDAENTGKLIAMLHALAAEEAAAVVIATHDLAVAATCRRRYSLSSGRLRENS